MLFERLINLNLAQKGFILVYLPLACGLFFIIVLAFLLEQAESETKREYRSKTIVAEVDRLNNLFLEQAAMASVYATTKNKALGQQMHEKAVAAKQEFKQLRQMCPEQKTQLAILDNVEGTFDRQAQLLQEMKQAIDSGSRELIFIRGTDLSHEVANLIKEMSSGLDKFVKAETAGQGVASKAAANSRSLVKIALAIGVILNILLACLLSLLVYKGMTARLDVLIDNTKRMVQQKDLNPRLQGTDELAHLDRVFHDMSDGLAQVEKLKKEFVAMISHDLRAPLSALQMYLSLLVDGTYGQLNDTGERRGQSALKSVAQLVKLINDLLDMEKLEAGRMEMVFKPTELNSVIEYSIESVRNLAEGSEVEIKFESKAARILADGDRLAQVLINLLSNAIKFSPKNGFVIVSAERIGEQIKVAVQDQGQGIPAQYRDLIFERFKQIPGQKKGGTGLGLPICKAIIEQHNGTIGVDSEEGKGSVFWFILPVEQEKEAATSTH